MGQPGQRGRPPVGGKLVQARQFIARNLYICNGFSGTSCRPESLSSVSLFFIPPVCPSLIVRTLGLKQWLQ